MARRDEVLHAIDRLQHLASLFSKRRSQIARRVGLTEAQWRVLEGVATEHFMPSMFADDLDNTRGAVSKILKQLLEKGLIKAAISDADGRQRDYTLTAKGERAIDTLRGLREDAIREIWSDLPLGDLRRFSQFCGQLIEKLRDYAGREDARNS